MDFPARFGYCVGKEVKPMNQKSSKSLLERLYRGEIFPAEDIVPRSKTYRDAEDEQNRCHDQLEEKLSEELVELLEEYKAEIGRAHV